MDFFRLLFYYPFRWIVNMLPMWVVFGLSRWGARLWAATKNRRYRRRITANIHSGVGGPISKRGLKGLYIDFLQTHIMVRIGILLYPSLAKKRPETIFEVSGRHFLDAALAQHHGAILTTTHMGPSMLFAFWSGAFYQTGLLRLLHKERLATMGTRIVYNLMQRLYQYLPVDYIDVEGDLSQRERILADNGVIVQIGDGSGVLLGKGRFLPLPFLGKQVFFARGPFSLAWRTWAPIVPYFLSYQKGKFRVVIEEAIWCHRRDVDKERAIRMAAGCFAGRFEKQLMQQPGTWQLWEIFENGKLIHGDENLHSGH